MGATERPWAYRPLEHDDWGYIRALAAVRQGKEGDRAKAKESTHDPAQSPGGGGPDRD
jgi:hypothetical protein